MATIPLTVGAVKRGERLIIAGDPNSDPVNPSEVLIAEVVNLRNRTVEDPSVVNPVHIRSAGFLDDQVRKIRWNGYIFVAVGYRLASGRSAIAYSYNGVNWYAGVMASDGSPVEAAINSLCWNGVKWVAGHWENSRTIFMSNDGIHWTKPASTNFNRQLMDLGWDGEKFVGAGASSSSASIVRWSLDGITWTTITGTGIGGSSGYAVCWNGSIWVVGGGDVGSSTYSLIYSNDGKAFSACSPKTGCIGNVKAIAWNGTIFVAVGNRTSYGTGGIGYSSDGINWTWIAAADCPFGYSGERFGIIWEGRYWVITGRSNDTPNQYLAISEDAVNWTIISEANDIFGDYSSRGHCLCSVPNGPYLDDHWNVPSAKVAFDIVAWPKYGEPEPSGNVQFDIAAFPGPIE